MARDITQRESRMGKMTESTALASAEPPRTSRQCGSGVMDPPGVGSRRVIEAMLRVGRAAVGTTKVQDVLDVILEEACDLAGTKSARITVLAPGRALRHQASIGMSSSFEAFLAVAGEGRRQGATEKGPPFAPTEINDTWSDAGREGRHEEDQRHRALGGNYRAVLAIPMVPRCRLLGTLELYRATAGPWEPFIVETLGYLAQHAATAIDRMTLVQSQRGQLDALERVVGALRGQTLEYAERLESLSSLLESEGIEGAQRRVSRLMAMHHVHSNSVVARLHDPLVAGLVLALVEGARQQRVDLRLHRASHLEGLPSALTDTEAVSIIANLVVNAVDAVAGLPRPRRRVSLRIEQAHEAVRIAVRDWGHGVRLPDREAIFAKGTSSKVDHAGLGLALVSDAVAAVNGRLSVRSHPRGTTFAVVLPFDVMAR